MNMRKLRDAGRTDGSDTFALSNLRPGTNGQTSVLQMAVLRGKAALVIDHHPVATLLIPQPAAIIRSIENLIRYPVPNSRHRSVRDGNHGNILGYIVERSQTKIPPGVPLIGHLTAQRIQCAVATIDVRHLLNKTVVPEFAIDRQAQNTPLISS